MPIFKDKYLYEVAFQIYKAAGVPEKEAKVIATHQVKANLAGHDSHGVIHLPSYIERVENGFIVPGAPFEIVRETPTTAVVNGHWGFGFVVAEKAMRLAIEKAKVNNVAAVTVLYQSHVGRVGDYPLMAAQEGMIGMMTADSGAGPGQVVPFGGIERRLGTNPICFAVPSNLEGHVLLDMATSTIASGKISVARAQGKKLPSGAIVDKEGNPSNDPNDFYNGGALLPVGGNFGHKGSGLSIMVEILSCILPGMGIGMEQKEWEARHGVEYRHNDSTFMAVFNIDAFYPLDKFKDEVTELIKNIKSSKPATGVEEVLYPGEPEWLSEQKRRKEGIFIGCVTWGRISELIEKFELESVIGKP